MKWLCLVVLVLTAAASVVDSRPSTAAAAASKEDDAASSAGITPPPAAEGTDTGAAAQSTSTPTAAAFIDDKVQALVTAIPVQFDQELTSASPSEITITEMAESREPPATAQPSSSGDKDKEAETTATPPKGMVSFDQRQHGKYNIRADLDNFMIILLPQSAASSTTKSPLFSLGGSGGGGSGLSGLSQFPASSLFDLFNTRRTSSATKSSSQSRRKYQKLRSQLRRKYKDMVRRDMIKQQQQQQEEEERQQLNDAELVHNDQQEAKIAENTDASFQNEATVLKEQQQPAEEAIAKERASEEKPVASPLDPYKMETLEKIQHQLEVLLKRVEARESSQSSLLSLPQVAEKGDHFVEERTPYRVDISSLHHSSSNEPETRVDVLPVHQQQAMPFRQYRDERPLEIGGGNHHGHAQPKYFQSPSWSFPADNFNAFPQRPLMVAFRDGRSLPESPLVISGE